jgi:hypothetical protein
MFPVARVAFVAIVPGGGPKIVALPTRVTFGALGTPGVASLTVGDAVVRATTGVPGGFGGQGTLTPAGPAAGLPAFGAGAGAPAR